MPRVLRVSATNPEPAVIAEAAAVLARGGLVAFPTETVYGLGARGLHADDVRRIFAAKERPAGHPLILHVEDESMARALAASWPDAASCLAQAFWPGPLTLVVERAPHVPDVVSGGLGTVGVRAPRHPVALALLRAIGEPLAAPSANAHMHVSPTTAAHVVRSLGDRVDLVLDAGPCAHGIESTVIDVAHGPPRVLRAGATSLEALLGVLPDVRYEIANVDRDAARASPGMASKHYAPRTRVVLADGGADFVAALEESAASAPHVPAGPGGAATDASRGVRAGVIVHGARAKSDVHGASLLKSEAHVASSPGPVLALVLELPSDADGYARGLFSALHEADAAGLDVLVIERVPDEPAWWAVADRLRRAAASDG